MSAIVDPESLMPPAVQVQHHEWCEAARACYALRDAAEERGLDGMAVAYLEGGDVYMQRALAITAEWDEPIGYEPLYAPTPCSEHPCKMCGGRGAIPAGLDPCPACRGAGVIRDKS